MSDYDIGTVGTGLTYRGGLSWRPVDDLQFRVQYARAERAPDLTELFSPPRGDTDSGIADPCDGVDADTPGALGANCRADAGIAAVDRKSGVQGKSVSVRVDIGGRRIIKYETTRKKHKYTPT